MAFTKDAETFDVIIVGGGPGGLSCARNLFGSGLRVLVLEKNNTLGKKICSGEISSKTFPGVEFPNGKKRKAFLDCLERCAVQGHAHEWKTVVVGTHRGNVPVTYDRPFLWTVGRFELENFLQSKCDAEIHFSEPVVEITKEYVVTNKAKYQYKYLIGADGSFSIVRQFLKLPAKHIVGWAFHYIIDKPADEFRVYWLPGVFPRGYGYVMSKNLKQTMIGGAMATKGMDENFVSRTLAPKVKDWVKKEFGFDTAKLKSEGMKGNADYKGWKFGEQENIFLVGDAAGLLNPVTTEGIYYAVKSGEGVAKFILKNPDGEKIMEKMASVHKAQVLLFDLANVWPFCWIVHWILENPKGFFRGRIFNYVFWKFMDN
jgi:geranylgeranyl reductase